MNNTMKRLLSLILALTICFALAMQASATTDALPEAQPGAETQTEEVAAEEATEEAPELTQENLDAALANLLLKLDADQTAQYGATLNTMNTPANVREDIVDAVNTCAASLDAIDAAEAQLEKLIEKMQDCTILEDIQKEEAVADLRSAWMQAEFFPVIDLMTQVEAMSADETVKLSTATMETGMEDLQDLTERMEATDALLGALELLPGIDRNLELLNASFAVDAMDVGNLEDRILLEVNEFTNRRQEIAGEIDGIFGEKAEDQKKLQEDITALSQELGIYPTLALMDTVRYADSVSADVTGLETALAENQSKMIIGTIALILAGVAILMAVVVAVFAVGKARGDKVDLSIYASRADVDAVSRQNKQLKMHNDQMGMRMETLIREVEQLKERPVVEAPRPEVVKVEAPVVVEPPKPEKPILGSDQQVGVLKMNYQFINPANSYLTENPAGKVILFSDDTVELAPSEMNITNELNGWINKGVFYLFEVEVDGKLLDPQRDNLPAGHHYITATIRRPVVKNMGNGSYIILSKGHIRMSR